MLDLFFGTHYSNCAKSHFAGVKLSLLGLEGTQAVLKVSASASSAAVSTLSQRTAQAPIA